MQMTLRPGGRAPEGAHHKGKPESWVAEAEEVEQEGKEREQRDHHRTLRPATAQHGGAGARVPSWHGGRPVEVAALPTWRVHMVHARLGTCSTPRMHMQHSWTAPLAPGAHLGQRRAVGASVGSVGHIHADQPQQTAHHCAHHAHHHKLRGRACRVGTRRAGGEAVGPHLHKPHQPSSSAPAHSALTQVGLQDDAESHNCIGGDDGGVCQREGVPGGGRRARRHQYEQPHQHLRPARMQRGQQLSGSLLSHPACGYSPLLYLQAPAQLVLSVPCVGVHPLHEPLDGAPHRLQSRRSHRP